MMKWFQLQQQREAFDSGIKLTAEPLTGFNEPCELMTSCQNLVAGPLSRRLAG